MNTRNTRKSVVVMAWLLASAPVSSPAEGIWTSKADMPTPRWGLSTCVIDGKIYAIGGGQGMIGKYMSPVEEYDPATDTWTKKADMPTGRAFLSTSAVNGKIYAIGGATHDNTDTSVVEEYDPPTDTWTRKADMPTERCFHSTCVVNGKIYAFGGRLEPADLNVSAVEVYDPATDTWTRKADMPIAKFGLSTSVIDEKIYVIGGVITPGGLAGPAISAVEEYDPVTESWTAKADMPTARTYLSTCVMNGKIYAIGGAPGSWRGILSTVEEYDPVADTWTKRPDMPTARDMFSTSIVNSKIYAIGGSLQYAPWRPCSTVEVLAPGLPDFNGDGKVDGIDVLILAECWGQDDPICDIAPLPFGDGLVDVQDLIALAECIGQEVHDPTLIAHWALDETEGATAHDDAGGYDATVIGLPAWRPAGGVVDGALEFDGATFVVADFVPNPQYRPFSVLAWVKGGAPGQVILSQRVGANWLMADAMDGSLMTELGAGGRSPESLCSEAVIADGEWHRVGLTWDGSNRRLCIDGVVAAEDTQIALEGSAEGLFMGCGKKTRPETFFTGLIDDVRIYNRAVKP